MKPEESRADPPRRLLSAADVKRIDAAAEAAAQAAGRPEEGVAALMARAGAAAAAQAAAMLAQAGRSGPVLAACGPGMNGGDGLVAARLLAERGVAVSLRPLGRIDSAALPAPAAEAWAALADRIVAPSSVAPSSVAPSSAALILDALFGVGLTRPIEGEAAALVAAINAASARPDGPLVLALDIPSGVAADTGRALGLAVRADETIAFTGPKRGHFLAEGAALTGRLAVADLGQDRAALEALADAGGPPVWEIAPALWGGGPVPAAALGAVAAHKYQRGSVLVASGGFGASGAARLTARAALRAGAGLATVAAPREAMAECAAQLTAVMLREAETPEAFAALVSERRVTAAALGPGHAAHPGGAARTRAFVEALLGSEAYRGGRLTAVLDADALSHWPDPGALFALLPAGAAILTPHGGEFARLFPDLAARLDPLAGAACPAGAAYPAGEACPAGEAARFGRIEAAREAAARSGATVVLKGFDTVVAAPDGRAGVQAAVGPRAAPWLATAGSGDVLAGIVAGIAAAGVEPFLAAAAGAWLHLEAALRLGPGMIAEDLTEAIPAALSG